MKTLITILVAVVSAIVAASDILRGRVALANTYAAAVPVNEMAVLRTNDAAITTRHLLWKVGSTDRGVALAGVGDWPLGTIDNVESATGQRIEVLLLGKGPTKKMVASAAIAVGALVAPAASGKCRTLPATTGTYYVVGVALTAAGADNDIIEVQDTVPYRVVVA